MHVMLLGAPGVGKGTQAQLLVEKYGVPQISTGDMLRAEIRDGTDLGRKVKAVMDAGELVSDDLILKIVEHRLAQPDCAHGFILDGFPRTIPQAEWLDTLLEKTAHVHLKVVEIQVSDEEIVERLVKRGRADDHEWIIRNRLDVYHRQTSPLIQYYSANGSFFSVNGKQDIEAVFSDLEKVLA